MSSALALVNIRHMRAGEEVDEIADPAAATRWLAGRHLLLATAPERPWSGAPLFPPVSPGDVARLRTLREAIRGHFAASAATSPPSADDVELLNAALAAVPIIPALTWGGAGPRRGEQFLPRREKAVSGTPAQAVTAAEADPVGVALTRIAGDALTMLTAPGGPQPAACQAYGCIRWFLRTHAARQWCSNRCGDRVRAARHYARQRGGSG